MKKTKQKGFTILELVVAIAIIGILSSIVIINVVQYEQKAKGAWVIGQINQIQKALDMYKNQYGYYPHQKGVDGETGIDACGCTIDGHSACTDGTFVEALQPLVDNGFIGKIKDFSESIGESCGSTTLDKTHSSYAPFFEYQTKDSSDTCGGEIMDSTNAPYYILIGSPFPITNLKSVGIGDTVLQYYYCVPGSK